MLLLVCVINNNDEFIIAEKFGTMGEMSVELEASGTGHAIANFPIFCNNPIVHIRF